MELNTYKYKGKEWISIPQLGGLLDVAPSHIYSSLKLHALGLPKMRLADDSQKRMYVTTSFAEQLRDDFVKHAGKVGLKELRTVDGFSHFMKLEGEKYKKKRLEDSPGSESLSLSELKAKIDHLSAILTTKLGISDSDNRTNPTTYG